MFMQITLPWNSKHAYKDSAICTFNTLTQGSWMYYMFSLEWTIFDKSLDSIVFIASDLCSYEYWSWENNKVSWNKQHRKKFKIIVFIQNSELRHSFIWPIFRHNWKYNAELCTLILLACSSISCYISNEKVQKLQCLMIIEHTW